MSYQYILIALLPLLIATISSLKIRIANLCAYFVTVSFYICGLVDTVVDRLYGVIRAREFYFTSLYLLRSVGQFSFSIVLALRSFAIISDLSCALRS